MQLKLIKLTKQHYHQLAEMIDEWVLDQQLNNTNRSPWAIFKNDYHNFDHYLANLDNLHPTDDHVPSSTYFLWDEQNCKLLGAVNIRHCLNDYLLQYAGHIGDGIRPTERNKGYGTQMVGLALDECKKLGIYQVLMVCSKNNVASAKTIIKNGGVLQNEFVDDHGQLQQRYWINLRE